MESRDGRSHKAAEAVGRCGIRGDIGYKFPIFSSLGYNMKNWKRLERDILHKASTNKALKYKKDEYGRVAYQVNMLLGISRKRMVATGWIIDKKGDNPRMITAYHNQKLKQAYREK